MVQLSLFSFLALLEAMAVLLLALGYLIWRQRRLRAGQTRIQFIDASEDHPAPALYLDREAARTRTFVEGLRAQPEAEPGEPALRSALAVRAALLRDESALAGRPTAERDADAWTLLAQQVETALAKAGFTTCQNKVGEIYGEDTGATEAIIAQQTRTIEHLREYIQQLLEKLGHEPLPDQHVLERFDELERANRELNQCIAVLEDENAFLRDQIAALLKLGHVPDTDAAGARPG